MAVLTKGVTISTGDQVTAANLNNNVDNATFNTPADNTTLQVNGSGVLQVKDTGINLTTKVTGTLPVANGGTGVTGSTGTGSVVLSNSPTLVTPALGTPASGVATNITGLPLTSGVTGTLPVANGGTGVTSSTGTGSTVLSNSPTLVTPALGTPASGVATNITGLPLTTGVTGTLPIANGGTAATTAAGARTALGVTATGADTTYAYRANNLSDLANAGTARTNLGVTATGSDTTYAYRANNLSDLASASTARTNLGLGSLATASSVNDGNWSGTDLAVANGGTGSSTASAARTALGVAIGSDVQAYDSDLSAIAGLAKTNGNFIVGNGSAWVAESGDTARVSLGLPGVIATADCDGSTASGFATASAGAPSRSSRTTTALADHHAFFNPNGNVGAIYTEASATTYNTTSDGRLKENFRPIEQSGEIIDALNPCKFDWKAGSKGDCGVIAQEAHEVFPQAVVRGDDGDEVNQRWMVDYSRFVPLLLAEVKSLRARLTDLENAST